MDDSASPEEHVKRKGRGEDASLANRPKKKPKASDARGRAQLSRKAAYSYTELPHSESIRIFELVPGSHNEPISIKLRVVRLGRAEQYNAVSYVWGDRSQTKTIDCNGRGLRVTTNLHSALVKIRHKDTPMTLWVDAICINQNDPIERGAQVSLMGRIYRSARIVFIYLDQHQHGDDNKVVSLIDEVDVLISRYPSIGVMPRLKPEDELYADPRWKSLKRMVEQPWFYRTWVIQEAGLARHPRVLYGDRSFEYEDLLSLGSWARECAIHQYSWLNLDLHIAWSQNWRRKIHKTETFLDLLNHTRGLSCTDPRDHVYAFLGHQLARLKDGSGTIINPDYSKDHLLVYLELAIAFISSPDNLRILATIEHTEESISDLFPSWVPRLNIAEMRNSIGVDVRTYYKASEGLSPTPCEVLADTLLKIRGIVFDEIRTISDLSFVDTDADEDESDTGSESPLPLAQTKEERYKAAFRALCEKTMNKDRRSAYHGEEDERIAFSLTLAAGCFGERPAEEEPDFSSHKADFVAHWNDCFSQQRGAAMETTAAEGDKEAFQYTMLLTCTGRSFITTKKGYYGLAPSIAKPGDLCCVIPGCTILYILRKAKLPQQYRFIGGSYIHDLMRGEIAYFLEKGEVKIQDLILC